MSPLPLSVQLYTLRDALAEDFTGALTRVAGLGFTAVEPYGLVDNADKLAEALPALGLTAPSAHTSILGQDLETVWAAAKKVGVTTVIDPHIPREQWTTADEIAAHAAALNEAAESAAGHGLTVGYHNHWWELRNEIDGIPALEVLIGQLNPDVVIELDTYWSQVGGVDAVALLEKLGDRVQLLHVKDGPVNEENVEQVAVGSGRMPVLDILAAAPHARRVVELDDFEGDVFDALADSIAYLTAHGETL